MIQKVGSKIVGSKYYFGYNNVKYDKNGWADAKKYLPGEYDLLKVKLKSGVIKSAWLSNNKFDGLKLKDDEEVLFWTRNKSM